MLKKLTRSDIADLRAQLIENHYDEATIVDTIGAATLPSAEEMPWILME